MFTEFLASGDLIVLPILGLGLFLTVFAGVLIYVAIGLKRGPALDRVAAMPLQEDVPDGGAAPTAPAPRKEIAR